MFKSIGSSGGIVLSLLYLAFFCLLGVGELALMPLFVYAVGRGWHLRGFQTPTELRWRTASLLALIAFSFFVLFPPTMSWNLIYIELVIGWIPWLARTIPYVGVDGPTTAIAAFCLVAVFFGSHWFISSAYNRPSANDCPARVWLWRWTACLAAAVFLMFVSGLAAYGLFQSSLEVWRLRGSP